MSASPARVVLLDSGGANLGSVQAAFARLGVDAPVTADPSRVADATHLVLPGVGAAGAAMARLRGNGLDALLPRTTQPLLGICVGMQLLFEGSEEGDTACLGLLPGTVRKLVARFDGSSRLRTFICGVAFQYWRRARRADNRRMARDD